MSWLDRLQQASFRGVAFYVDSASRSFGRRVALHEYPNRDIPYGEDLGRKTRTFSVSGYLVGDDYDDQREKLIAACETAGEAFYVDPYRGRVNVLCVGFSVSETRAEGNTCTFSLELVEVGKKEFPAQAANPSKSVLDKATSLKRAASKKFSAAYTLDGLPGFVQDSTAAVMGTFATPFKTIVTVTGEFKRAINNIDDAAGTIVGAYDTVLAAIESPFSLLHEVGTLNERNNVLRLLSRFSEGLPSINELTGTRVAERRAHRTIGELVDTYAVADGITQAVNVSYASNSEAKAVADYWTTAIDDYSETETDHEVYSAYVDLRSALVTALPAQGQRLPDIKTIELKTVEPSLVTSYRLYGDALRAEEVALRNSVRHPAFMPADFIEVLSE